MEKNNENSSKTEVEYPIIVNAMIEVKPRTWPGINKPGGIAKVTGCHYKFDDKSVLSHVDVHYIVGRSREKMVPLEYVTPAPQYDDAFQRRKNEGSDVPSGQEASRQYQRLHLRDRSALLGRCKLCGSLRSDCGSCDWIEEERQQRLQSENNAATSDLIYDDSSSDQSDIGILYKDRRKRIQIESSSSDEDISEESSDESSDDEPLSNKYSFASQKFITARKTARKLANAEKMNSIRHKRTKEEKRRKLKTKYKASDKQFKERLRFLNTLLSSSKASSRVNDSDRNSSILESIGDETQSHLLDKQTHISRPSKIRRTNFSKEELHTDINGTLEGNHSVTTQNEMSVDDKVETPRVGFVDDDEIGEKEDDEDNGDDNHSSSLNELPRITKQIQKESLRTRIKGYYNSDSQLDDFIQPEGTAEFLPSDVVDRLAGIHFDELPDFLNELHRDLTDSKLPEARKIVSDLSKRYEHASASSANTVLLELENECRIQFEALCSSLVRDGTDQYRFGLKRFSKRREFRMSSSKFSKRNWIELSERLDMRFDDVDKEVESLLRELRNVLEECAYSNGYNSEPSINSEESDGDSNAMYSIYDSGLDDDAEREMISNKSLKRDLHEHASNVRHETSDTHKSMKQRVSSIKNRSNGHKRQNRLNYNVERVVFEDKQLKNSSMKAGKSSNTHKVLTRSDANHRQFASLSQRKGDRTKCDEASSGKMISKPHTDNNGPKDIRCEYDQSSSDTEVITLLSLDALRTGCSDEKEHLKHHSEDIDGSMSVFEVCDHISSTFPSETCLPMLDLLPSLYSNPHLGTNKRHVAVTILETLLRIVNMHRSCSLQDILQNKPNLFVPQVMLLKTTLHLLVDGIGDELTSSDGLIFKIFHRNNSILNIVTNQIIDILYSQYRQEVWGSGRLLNLKQYGALCQLRHQLGKNTNCLEIFSSCLMTSFESQNWFKSTLDSHDQKWFVSSINPNVLDAFWNGISNHKEVRSRLSYFKKMCPREEIDTIWKMLLWFGAERSSVETTTSNRWRLVVTLFSYRTGVYGLNLKPMCIKDPNFQYVTPEMTIKSNEELTSLRVLLSSGALDPLPSEDTIISRLFHLSFLLSSRAIEKNMLLKPGSIFCDMTKQDAKFAHKLWKDSSSSVGTDEIFVIFNRLHREMYELPNTEGSIFTLNPNSPNTRAALSLVVAWANQLPDKKARWSRFFDSISATCTKILRDAELVRNENIRFASQSPAVKEVDPFGASFSTLETPIIEENDPYHLITTACEYSAHLMLCVEKLRERSAWDGDLPSTKLIDLDFCKMIWNVLSSEGMKSCHRDPNTSFAQYEPIKPLFMILKVFSSILYHNLNRILEQIKTNENLSGYEKDSDIFKFLISCIVTCFKAISYNIQHDQGNKKTYTTHIFLNQSENSRTQTSLLNVLSCGLLWMSCLVDQIALQLGEFRLKINCIVDDFLSFSSTFFNLSSNFMVSLTQSKMELNVIDVSFRLCLAFTQSLLKLDFERKHSRLLHPLLDDARSVENQFTPLTSSIDSHHSQNVNHNRLWDFLMLTIQKSKPSERYAIEKDTAVTYFSHQGRTLSARHTCFSCSALVHLCIYSNSDMRNAKSFLERLRHMDMTSSISDSEFFTTIQECFCAKLLITAEALKAYQLKLENINDEMLHCYLRSCLSASTLNYFPTSDFDAIDDVGYESSKKRERAILMKALSKLENFDARNKYDHLDRDSVGLKIRNNYVDSPREYLASHFWRWTQHMSFLFGQYNDDLDICVQEVCTNIINGISPISIEKECIKRVMVLRSIMSKYIQQCSMNMYQDLSLFALTFTSIIITFISEIKAISRGVCYYEQSNRPEELYKKSKALVLQKSFTTLYTCFFSWLIGELSLHGPHLADYSSFIYRFIITPALNGMGIDQSREIVDSLRRLSNSDLVQLERLSIATDLNTTLVSNLQRQSFKYIRTSIMYATNCSQVINPGTVFYSLMNMVCTVSSIDIAPVIHPEIDPTSAGKLESSLILYFSVVSMLRNDFVISARKATKTFREYAIRNFIVPKLRHPTVDAKSKVRLLMILSDILETSGLRVIFTDILDEHQIKSLENNPTLDLRYDVCAILDAIYLCIQNDKTTGLLSKSYDVLGNILKLAIGLGENEEPLAHWSFHNQNSSALVQYFNLHLQIFADIAKLCSDSYKSKYPSIWDDVSKPITDAPLDLQTLKTLITSKEKLDATYFPRPASDSTQNAYRSNPFSQKRIISTSDTSDPSINTETENCLKKFLKVYADHQSE